jgi:hypothetical protein
MLPKLTTVALSLASLSSAYVVDLYSDTNCQGEFQTVNVWDNTCAAVSLTLVPTGVRPMLTKYDSGWTSPSDLSVPRSTELLINMRISVRIARVVLGLGIVRVGGLRGLRLSSRLVSA